MAGPFMEQKMTLMRNLKLLFLLLVLADSSILAGEEGLPESLDQQFQTPPRQAQPWVYWMWLHTDTTPAAMTRDLEQMKAKGIPGFILYDTGTGHMRGNDPKPGPVNGEYQFETV